MTDPVQRPLLDTCATCSHFAALSPGHAAICFRRWRDLKWNDAVPLTTKDGWCDKHKPRAAFDTARREGEDG